MDKDEELETMKEAFNMFDKNSDGSITVEEFANFTRAMGCNPTDKEIREYVTSLDKDENGSLDFNEFKEFYKSYKKTHNDPEDIKKAFAMFDKDGNGYIDKKELKKILHSSGQNMSDEEIDDMIKSVDVDDDGRINYIEFANITCSRP